MHKRGADVVCASGLKYTDPYTRCFIFDIAPGVTEAQLQKQLNHYGLVQIYTYSPATARFPGWAWVGYHTREGVKNLLEMSAAVQKAVTETRAKATEEASPPAPEKPEPEVDTVETLTTRVDTEHEVTTTQPEHDAKTQPEQKTEEAASA